MPVPVTKTATGRYLVLAESLPAAGRTVAYCRVSSADQTADLERQAGRVAAGATALGLVLSEVVTEIGSGLDARRAKLAKLLRDPTVTAIVVEHRDRLARFGVDHLTCALAATGRRIIVLDDTELADDLVRDMTEILTWFCAQLYGRRSAGRKAKAAMVAAEATP
ncbi:MAG: putative resolvase [Micromonosporaceae bacterium]|jgi:putative resolvase|nr:putative resolvase [Micromonosporaceae bacterium]